MKSVRTDQTSLRFRADLHLRVECLHRLVPVFVAELMVAVIIDHLLRGDK